jgi:molybdopterin molybdotransferase
MPEFLKLVSADNALKELLAVLPPAMDRAVETISTDLAVGRILASDVRAPHPLPPFDRSTVDGFAVRASDTHGASQTLPAYLSLVGEVQMGRASEVSVETGQAAVVHTGGMIPDGADSVVMIEDTQYAREQEIEILKPAAVGENILQSGEDVITDEVVLPRGTILRAQEIGGLMALGITRTPVKAILSVGIISSGDEVIPPDEEQEPGQVRDINSYTLGSLVETSGARAVRYGIVADTPEDLEKALRKSLDSDDMVLVTAGSSVSARDLTATVINSVGKPGVLVHGISIKPGKPTILALLDEKPVIGLPGNPVSAMVVAGLIVLPVLRQLQGRQRTHWSSSLQATLAINVASKTGREDFLPVSLESGPDGLIAHPVFGRSNLIFTLIRADGLVRIPPEATGLPEGEIVHVQLFN